MTSASLFSVLLPALLLLPGVSLLAGALARLRTRPRSDGLTARMRALASQWGCRVAPWPESARPVVVPERLGSEACVAEIDGRRLAVVWIDASGLLEDRGTDWVVARADGSPRVAAHGRSEVEIWREDLRRLGGVEGTALLVAPSGFRWPGGRPARGVVGEERLGEALGLARRLTERLPEGAWPPFFASAVPETPGRSGWAGALLRGAAGGVLLLAGLALAVAGGEWARALGRLAG